MRFITTHPDMTKQGNARGRRHGFTLIELLVVIAIIAVLIALLLPAVQKVRESGNRLQCQNNLKQFALACHNYHDANKGFPRLYSSSTQLGWMTQVLPYVEQLPLYESYNLTQPWFDASNAHVVNQTFAILVCPTSPVAHIYTATDTGFAGQSASPDTVFSVASTDYFAFSGSATTTASYLAPTGYPTAPKTTDVSGPFGPQASSPSSYHLTSVTDGTSSTLMLGEMSGRPWLFLTNSATALPVSSFPTYVTGSLEDKGDDIPLDYGFGAWAHNNNFNVGVWGTDGRTQGGPCAINCSNYRGVFSFHSAGANVAFADASVHMLGSAMSAHVFLALTTARAGEEITDLSALY